MFSKLTDTLGIKGFVFVLIILGLIVSGFVYWVNWSLDMKATVTAHESTIKARDKTITELQGKIDTYFETKSKTEVVFKDIDDSQVDLLCAARYQAPVLPKPEPTIVEVVKYRDRDTKCPTTDPERAEVATNGAIMRPVNDEIRAQTLNNSWKAYCAATDNKEDVCMPFR